VSATSTKRQPTVRKRAGSVRVKRPATAAADDQPASRSRTVRSVSAEAKGSGAKKGDEFVRDRFTMPAREYKVIGELKERCRAFGVIVKKSELLRAGLAAIRELPDARLREFVTPLVALRAARSGQGKRSR
jgi:hypothetical protein